ncbi:MAG: protein-L-isoaspartate(D-aspartate) O-methyltransferase, partial [Candidatus Omnitrophica bacterium]|nr:protein-L-isoaspartate(D-aspartate) O-methyltransferase [Candidatus Omnitrophota bacterium]
VSKDLQPEAYADHPLPIGGGQTISQPYMVALMVQLLHLQGHERVLEIGTGSGYQLAILSQLALEVYSIERLPELADQSLSHLEELGYLNVHVSVGNGTLGWPEHAPYEGILIAAGAPAVPPPLVRQLADGGRMVIPLGSQQVQTLTLVEKRRGALSQQPITHCVFVPLLGEYGWRPEELS